MRRLLAGLLLGALALAPHAARAQTALGATAVALGGAYTARAQGPAAAVWNPAALALPTEPRVAVTLASVSGTAASNSVSLDLYNRVSGAYLDDSLKSEIVAAVPASGFEVAAHAEGGVVGFSIGRFAVTSHVVGSACGLLPREVIELVLYGNEPGRTYSIDGADGAALATGGVQVATAAPVHLLGGVHTTVGLGVERIVIARSAELLRAEGYLAADSTSVSSAASIDARIGEKGSGWGLTLGLAAAGHGGWQAGLVLQSIGSVSFSEGTIYTRTVQMDSVDVDNVDDVDVVTTSSDSIAAPRFSMRLPVSLRGGVSFRAGPMLASTDVSLALTRGGVRDNRTSASVGLELFPRAPVHVRAGGGTGGLVGPRYGLGLGFRSGPVTMDLAVQSLGSMSPGGARGAGAAFDMGLRF